MHRGLWLSSCINQLYKCAGEQQTDKLEPVRPCAHRLNPGCKYMKMKRAHFRSLVETGNTKRTEPLKEEPVQAAPANLVNIV